MKKAKVDEKPKTAKKAEKHQSGAATTRLEAKKDDGQGKGIGENTKPKIGRPTDKTPAITKRICDGIATGKSARAMCVEVGIAQDTLWNWLSKDKEFSEQYARAKSDCADYLAAEIIEIADDGSRDYVVDEDGREVPDHDHIQRSRLRVDARKWYASKLAPKKYGDKSLVGSDPDNPLPAGYVIVPAKIP